tara:strand:+ start:2802 stop:2930 length:129 start_codon:yes stop_codon:yes gene_type:complete
MISFIKRAIDVDGRFVTPILDKELPLLNIKEEIEKKSFINKR